MFLYIQGHLCKTGHSHRVMRDYAITLHNNSVGTKINMYNISESNYI